MKGAAPMIIKNEETGTFSVYLEGDWLRTADGRAREFATFKAARAYSRLRAFLLSKVS
jgi:hypothetical protein